MVDYPLQTIQVLADDIQCHITSDHKIITAKTTDHLGHHVVTGTEYIESIITLKAIHLNGLFNTINLDIQAGAKYALFRDNECIVFLGTDNDHSIEAQSTVDAYRSINVVLEVIVITATLGDNLVLGDECADEEGIITGFAFHT